MAQLNRVTKTDRTSRVKRLKRVILTGLLLFILLPYVFLIILAKQVERLDEQNTILSAQLRDILELLGPTDYRSTKPLPSSEPVTTPSAEPILDEPPSGLVEQITPNQSTQQTPEAAHKVYLTFDDGPSAYTEDILDILDEYGVKATFFVVGKEDDRSKERILEIVNRGHTLGMHSYSHVYRDIYKSVDAFAADLKKIQDYLYELTGVKSTVYRFPGGSSNTISDVDVRTFIEYLDEQGIAYFDWNISSGDASINPLSVSTIVQNTTSSIDSHSVSVILMHDALSKKSTVEALPLIIEKILENEDTVILPITEETILIQHIQ
ncbi:MAG: polysaccharide deacetylase [Lachnospiraceae bacterium]|jgi:peptidoglycan/xylan/chitin deacetylase (PgdA/CDA1 family)|nr:polysaccharide deacetylase [Lachnospiraceae bacterium]